MTTISHHPDEALLAAYAAGSLDLGEHVAIATHLVSCAHCRAWARSLERVGGALLDDAPPAALADGALERALAQIGESAAVAAPAASVLPDAPPQLPRFVRSYAFGPWRRVAPRISVRPIRLPEASPTRVFLLKSAPGANLVQHEHTGLEITCVLSGAFSHEGGRFGPGDFDLGDPAVAHEPRIEAGVDCVCLVAMRGDLRFSGFIGRLMQPFVRL
jgi:putative transcriptional regulator